MKSAMRFDLADLRLFVSIVDAGSITKGAAQANLALASASERLRNIEAAAGVPLLHRQARGIATTEAGEALMHHARAILQQQVLLRRELGEFAAGARGRLNLYANTAALTDFLPRSLAPWLAQRPNLHLELKERTSAEIVRAVANGHAEAGIASDAADAMGLQQLRLVKDHLVLICPTTHRFASRKSVCFEQVLGEPFVGLAAGNALQDLLETQAQTAGHRLQSRVRLKTFESVCEMVSHGVGVGVVPQHAALRYKEQFDFPVQPLQDAWASRWLCACYRDWEALSPPMRNLLDHLREQASAQP